MRPESIRLTVAHGVAQLVLRREETRNAFAPAMLAELETALARVEQAAEVRLLILRGTGKVFSSGVDLAAVDALSERAAREFFARGRALMRHIETLDALTLALIDGVALGAGFELALACDKRWAHSRALFGFPECRLGLVPAWGGVRLLHRHLSAAQIFKLVSEGHKFGARAAQRLGVVDRIFAGALYEAQVEAAIDELCAGDPRVLKARPEACARPMSVLWDRLEAVVLDRLWAWRASAKAGRPVAAGGS